MRGRAERTVSLPQVGEGQGVKSFSFGASPFGGQSLAIGDFNGELRIHDLEKNRLEEHIKVKHAAHKSYVKNIDMHLEKANVQIKLYHLPAFIYKQMHGHDALYKCINGYNGTIDGEKVVKGLISIGT